MKSSSDLRELIRKYGTNSNAFFSLYPGFSNYPADGAAVAYLRTRTAHVAVTEPFARGESRMNVLEEFFRYSRDQGANALALPVGADFAREARERGLDVIPVGTEVLFELRQMAKRGEEWTAFVPGARQLSERGGVVREVTWAEQTSDLRLTLDEIYRDWIRSKHIPPLGFLNRVEPWTLAEDKRLFVVTVAGRVVAFLSAIPIWSRNGWYLVDLIRTPKAPVGASELLLLESMRLLHESRAEWVSLGVAPLADLKDVQFGGRRFLFRMFRRAFEMDSALYPCKSLYQFKLKFRPTHLEPAYLVAAPGTTIPRILSALGEAYLPLGLLGTVMNSVYRSVRRAFGLGVLDRLTDASMVLRPLPTTAGDFFRRTLVSWSLIASWIAIFALQGQFAAFFDRESIGALGFSWHEIRSAGFGAGEWERIVVSGFLHQDWLHLGSNIFFMILFGPALEIFCGRAAFALAFAVPLLLSNLLTAFFFQGIVMEFPAFHIAARSALAHLDVGASLGIFGCLGGLLPSLHRRWAWALFAILGIGAYSAWSENWFHMNHAVAIGLGWLVLAAFQWLKRRRNERLEYAF